MRNVVLGFLMLSIDVASCAERGVVAINNTNTVAFYFARIPMIGNYS